MGQCGCSDTAPIFRFPGPDGVHYGIQIYPSCHYCSTPVGVDVYRFSDEEAESWLNGVEEAPFTPYSQDNPTDAILSIPVVGAEELAAEVAADQREDAEYNGADAEDFREISEEDVRHALAEAVRKTFETWSRSTEGGQTP